MNKQSFSLDLPSLRRVSFGFDDLFNGIHQNFANTSASNYPPYNIVRVDETHTNIEIAVAGFDENELSVELKDGVLSITGEQASKETQPEYLFQGISGRKFCRTFSLTDQVEVLGAQVKNGIMVVSLLQNLPIEEPAKKISITFQK